MYKISARIKTASTLNFEQDHLIDSHRFQCNKPTTLTLDNVCVFLKFQRNMQLFLRWLQAKDSNADYILDGSVFARWSENTNIVCLFFSQKVHTFQMVIIVSRTSHISYKWVLTEY